HGGPAALQPQSSRPHPCATIFTPGVCEALRALLHQSPRTFGKPTSRWTLALAAEVSFAPGLTPRLVSDEAIRVALRRLRVSWKRAKHWITSPAPASARKKTAPPADPAGDGPSLLGAGLWRRSLVESPGPAQPTWLDGRRNLGQGARAEPAPGRS